MSVFYIIFGLIFFSAMIYLLAISLQSLREQASQDYFCDSCSYHLGTGRNREKVCPRCGDYRYYIRKPSSADEK